MFSEKIEYTVTKEEHHWTSEEKLRYCGCGELVEEPDLTIIERLGTET